MARKPEFNPAAPNYVDAMQWSGRGSWATKLRNGDIAQFRGRGLISSWIRWATQGVHTHSGMVRINCDGRADLLEVRELKGGRAVPLLSQVMQHPGRIDIFRPRVGLFQYDRDEAVELMRKITAKPYGYLGIARLLAQRLPVVWRFARIETRDVINEHDNRLPFCSHAVATACRVGGGIDPVPRKPDAQVTPADLTRSLLFDYVCTLVP